MGHCIARVASLLQSGATVPGLTGSSRTVIIPGGFLVVNTFSAFQIVDTSADAVAQEMRITAPLNLAVGTFTYSRRAIAGTYTVWTSTDLKSWTQDQGAVEQILDTVGGSNGTDHAQPGPAGQPHAVHACAGALSRNVAA